MNTSEIPITIEQWIEIAAIFTSPITAVLITLWYQDRKEKLKRRMDLFLTLIATRKTIPVPPRFVDALNMIDVVFHEKKEVIAAWRDLFTVLHTRDGSGSINIQNLDRRLLDLLDAMAKSVGYNGIKQTALDSFYSPQLFANQQLFQETLNSELLRVFQNSEHFGNNPRSNQNIQN